MSFTFGDTVRVRPDAPQAARPAALGQVVAITRIESDALAATYRAAVGDTLYLVEFGDGESTEVEEGFLEAVHG